MADKSRGMGDSELSDIARRLAKKFNIPEHEPGRYQGRVFFIEQEPGLLRYGDKVCGFTFQHLPDEDIRQVQYRVLASYLDAQLEFLRATKTGVGLRICGCLEAIRKKPVKQSPEAAKLLANAGFNAEQSQVHLAKLVSDIGLRNFDEVEEFVTQHIVYH